MNYQQNQHSQSPTATRKTNYANVTSKDSFPKREQAIIVEALNNVKIEAYLDALANIVPATAICFISRIAQNRICIYLESIKLAEELVERKLSVIINNKPLLIKPLIARNKRVVLSNVCPAIPHYILEEELRKLGINPLSSITYLRTGTANPKYTHILSFRRQVYVSPEDEKKLPEAFQINYEDINYWIYPSCDSLKCFMCKELGHLARNCQLNNPDNQQNQTRANTTQVDNQNLPLTQESTGAVLSTKEITETIQEIPETLETITQENQKMLREEHVFIAPRTTELDHSKRPHPPTCSTVSSTAGKIAESESEMELDSDSDQFTTDSDDLANASNLANKPYNEVLTKNTLKKRKLDFKEEAYEAAWNNIKQSVENQKPPSDYALNIDQLRHLMENSKVKQDLRDLIKDYSDNVEGLIRMCDSIRPHMTKTLKAQTTRFVKKLKLILV